MWKYIFYFDIKKKYASIYQTFLSWPLIKRKFICILFPCQILINVYSSLITPYLNYGILVWGMLPKFLLDLLSCIQKRAIRNVNHAGYLSHTNSLFHKNKILKTTDLFNYNVGIFMYQLSTNELPEVFTHMCRKKIV